MTQQKKAKCVQVHSPPAVACVAVAATAVESPSCSCQTAWPAAPQARHAAAASVVETAYSASAAAAAVDIVVAAAAAAAESSAQCKHKFRMMPAEQHVLGVLRHDGQDRVCQVKQNALTVCHVVLMSCEIA